MEQRVTLIYVHPEAAGLGIATLLYHHLEDEARVRGIDELVTEASLVARDFFVFLGFEVDSEESVERRGVTLPPLAHAQAPGLTTGPRSKSRRNSAATERKHPK